MSTPTDGVASSHTRGSETEDHSARVRIATDERDAYFAARWVSHYFGWPYDDSTLPTSLATAAGWVDADDPDDPDPSDYHVVIAEAEGIRVGCGIARCIHPERAADEFDAGPLDEAALVGDLGVTLSFSAVDPAWRGRGIATEMFQRRLDWARDIGAETAVGHSWHREGRPDSRPLFERFGFQPILDRPDYYRETRDACPDCGITPTDDATCTCGATLFARDF